MTRADKLRLVAKSVVALVVIALVVWVFRRLGINAKLQQALQWIEGLGAVGPFVFCLVYILACVLFISGAILTLGAGAVFGLVQGTIYTSIASILGASAAFLVGRYLARDKIAKKIAGDAKFKAIDEAVAEEGWKIVGLTRLSPVFPFVLLNYAFGLTKVSFRHYVLASWIAMLPGTVMYVYIGAVIGDIAALDAERTKTPAEWALLIVGLIVTMLVTVYVTRIAKRALDKKIDEESSTA
ncbi:MAG: TVP38/TMEM64 family protein [Verrucomicrobia bacterium]|nr:TVP38/TMEM64 family protein [Verrucomicrobiota bacterium]